MWKLSAEWCCNWGANEAWNIVLLNRVVWKSVIVGIQGLIVRYGSDCVVCGTELRIFRPVCQV